MVKSTDIQQCMRSGSKVWGFYKIFMVIESSVCCNMLRLALFDAAHNLAASRHLCLDCCALHCRASVTVQIRCLQGVVLHLPDHCLAAASAVLILHPF